MKKIPFVKMHGLGNDFVIMAEKNIPKAVNMTSFAKSISDRRMGIGCDQFITYTQDFDAVKMSIYNQDGTKAKACGNASRCLSRLIFDDNGIKNLTLEVSGRKILCEYINADEIKVNMGAVSFDENWMPEPSDLWALAERHLIEPKEMLCIDVGNPHLVIFSKLSPADKVVIGKNFQNIELFKDGINVNFVSLECNKISLKVWERGAGFTNACGSGAVASFAAANKLGFADDSAEVIFEHGKLSMQKKQDSITMCGPATYTFSGEFVYE